MLYLSHRRVMVMTTFNEPQHQMEEAARAWFENLRWPDAVVCPHCGTLGRAYARSRPGLYRCAEKECRKDFTVTTKSVMESSHIPLRLWAQAFTLLCSSKKGMSAHQVHRTLKITYKSAWFLCHRIREAMRSGGLDALGGSGKIVEADETYFGDVPDAHRRASPQRGNRPFTMGGRVGVGGKRAIVSLVERGGNVRSFHVAVADGATVANIVNENVLRESRLHTDESRLYIQVGANFAAHETVVHSAKEYVRGDVTTNSVEGYFSIFKRGMRGNYRHCKEKHLHRYLAEFDFRYNHRVKLGYNDGDRAALAVKGAANKRLTYRQSH
jgi:transposase-like protein